MFDPIEPKDVRRITGAPELAAQAVELLETFTRSLPEERDAHYHLAEAYLLLGRVADARREFQATLRCDPTFLPALAKLSGDNKRTELAPPEESEWQLAWWRAYEAKKRGDWAEVARAYEDLLYSFGENEPYVGSRAQTCMGLGKARLVLGDYESAQLEFRAAMALAPGSLEPPLLLAKAFLLAGEKKPADVLLDRLWVNRQELGVSELAFWVASLYRRLGDYESVLFWSKRIAEPSLRERLCAYSLARLGSTESAIEAASRAVAFSPADATTHLVLGMALLHDILGDPGGARDDRVDWLLESATTATKLNPQSGSARDLFAVARRLSEPAGLEPPLTREIAPGNPAGRFGGIRLVEGISTCFPEMNPHVSADGLELYFNSWRPTGSGGWDIYVATRPKTDLPFGNVRPLDELNTITHEGQPHLSSDGSTIYFGSYRAGGKGANDLWIATRDAPGEPFRNIHNLTELNTPFDESGPSLTANGLALFFYSNRPDGAAPLTKRPGQGVHGGPDNLYIATRATRGAQFGEVRKLCEVSSGFDDITPCVSADGSLLVWSDRFLYRPGGCGLADIWFATREAERDMSDPSARFAAPRNLGAPVNSAFFEAMPDLSSDWPADGARLYFMRGFPGFVDLDIYEATWSTR